MSVAFRREGDEEHLEPKFEIPIPPGPNLVTPRGLALIGERVAAVEAQVAELADRAADDPQLKSAKRDLRYWQTRQITAELVPAPSGETVEIGTRVTFRMNGKERTLGIVGDDEADPTSGLVSYSAPLARALMGAQAGDLLDFSGKDGAIEVLAIAPIF
ncbi:GreA/GreB family elongation factor [Novosphingobium sp.]|uniref:GreA/GreB family elongation factor n=1 Tax=Novosphingobium sp. TaxID=1874826 RepID=UPI00286D6E7F|nr:GreA/GreB family elongation factor [Novosphingobium sp.]